MKFIKVLENISLALEITFSLVFSVGLILVGFFSFYEYFFGYFEKPSQQSLSLAIGIITLLVGTMTLITFCIKPKMKK